MDNRWLNRKLRAGDYMDYGVEFFRRNLKPLVLMILVFHVPVTLLSYLLINPSGFWNNFYAASQNDLTEGIFLRMIGGSLLQNVYVSTLYYVLQIAVIYYTYRKIAYQEEHTVRESLRQGFRRFGWMIVYNLLLGTALSMVILPIYLVFIAGTFFTVYIGSAWLLVLEIFLVLLVILAIAAFLYTKLYFVPHAIAVRGCNAITAIRLSWKYTRKRFWNTFGTLFWTACLVGGIPSVISAVSAFLPFSGSMALSLLAAVLRALASILEPLGIVITTVLFFKRETEQEDAVYERELHRFLQERGA